MRRPERRPVAQPSQLLSEPTSSWAASFQKPSSSAQLDTRQSAHGVPGGRLTYAVGGGESVGKLRCMVRIFFGSGLVRGQPVASLLSTTLRTLPKSHHLLRVAIVMSHTVSVQLLLCPCSSLSIRLATSHLPNLTIMAWADHVDVPRTLPIPADSPQKGSFYSNPALPVLEIVFPATPST